MTIPQKPNKEPFNPLADYAEEEFALISEEIVEAKVATNPIKDETNVEVDKDQA